MYILWCFLSQVGEIREADISWRDLHFMPSTNLPHHTWIRLIFFYNRLNNDHISNTAICLHKISGTRICDAPQWIQLKQGSSKVVLCLLYSNFPGEYKSTCVALCCGGKSREGHSHWAKTDGRSYYNSVTSNHNLSTILPKGKSTI